MRPSLRPWLGLVALLLAGGTFAGAQQDLSEYRTPERAIPGKIAKAEVTTLTAQAFLGVQVGQDGNGWLVVREVSADSPAAKAGAQRGDQLLLADGTSPQDDGALSELLARKS